MPEELLPAGYDEEERYFHERNLELVRRKRAELDAARQAHQEAARRSEHWMKCPKCGGDLREVELDNVMVDKCADCEGIFFDKGEIELLIQANKGFARLRKLFGG